MAPLSQPMIEMLRTAAAQWNGSIPPHAHRGIWIALLRRGLVDVEHGTGRDRRGNPAYGVVVGIRINDAGRAALAGLENA